VSTASIAIVATNGVGALRQTLHRVRDTVGDGAEIIVLADQHHEDVVTYVTRHYLRGDVTALGLDADGHETAHCGLDRAFRFSSGEVLIRLQDDLELRPTWFEAVMDTFARHDDIGLLGLVQVPEPKHRGRPPKTWRAPEACDEADLRAFATRRTVFAEYEAHLLGEKCVSGCRYQGLLRKAGVGVAYLPGQVTLAHGVARATAPIEFDADLPGHPSGGTCLGYLRQRYQLGEEILGACMACGEEDFEVLAAQIEFCDVHGVPVGYTYTLRCTSCGESRHEEDLQFRCP
jgi:hypothetical protein